ncbi:Argininosuccinate lyase [Staphylococcus aureus]|uniref:Argininosuccinate lyase n=1 Tax=Staphylococcus aureus TaxID=1280 RepID=A0A380EFG2_STAAU|nr:Argininosuccinate lyase [Staphylococcus aureus]
MLANQGIISQQDSEQIIQGLKSIQHDYHQDQIQFSASLEDIHLNIEHELIKRIGDAGGKLHTGRSRNDQVATDMHLYTKKQVQDIIALIKSLQSVIVDIASIMLIQLCLVILIYSVHSQFHCTSYYDLFLDVTTRPTTIEDSLKRIDINPLGAAALSGTTYPIDRHETTALLNFGSLYENSLDAVSDRGLYY